MSAQICPDCQGPLKDDYHGYLACFCLWDGRIPTVEEVIAAADRGHVLQRETNLFIPLKREFYNAFAAGKKTHEYRLYGGRWNEKTCRVGRMVTLSLGYGKRMRMVGVIKSFTVHSTCPPETAAAFNKCYGTINKPVADIELEFPPE